MTDVKQQRHDISTPFKTLVAEASDFDLLWSTHFKIGLKYDLEFDTSDHFYDTSRLSPEERTIVLVLNSARAMELGGFEYLLSEGSEQDTDWLRTAEAHKDVGLHRAYEAFQRVFAAFPNQSVPVDPKQRIEEYKLQDKATREETETMYWGGGREKAIAAFIRCHADKFQDMDEKEPTAWSQARDSASAKELVPIITFGVLMACVSAALYWHRPWWHLITTSAGIVGAFLAWIGQRLWRRNFANQNLGWLDRLLDEAGREHVIVWKPLGREIMDDDIAFARSVGHALDEEKLGLNEQGRCISVLTLETQFDAVGIRIRGWNPDDMLMAVRPFLQKHFPHGSFLLSEKWPQPQPLFEGDKITACWWRG